MKKILLLIPLLLTLTACASDRITATLTITNTPVYGNTLVANAKTLNWTNSTAGAPNTSVLIGASIGASATNLFRQLATYPLTGPVNVGFSSSNVLTFVGQTGQSMAFSMAGTWATLSYSTQVVATMTAVRVPATSEPTQSSATNIFSEVAKAIGTHSTNAFPAGSKAIENIVQTTGVQTIGGAKTFSAAMTLSDALTIKMIIPKLEFWDDAGSADKKRGKLIYDNGALYLEFYTDAGSAISETIRFTEDDIIVSKPIYAQGNLLDSPSLTNAFYVGTQNVGESWAYNRANHTSLANGPNAGVNFGAKVYAKIKAGPSAAFSINGITGGTDGRILILDNSIAQNMTIANDSGVEPTAANRIYTRTGGDIATTGQGVVTLIYDSEDSRWVVVSVRD